MDLKPGAEEINRRARQSVGQLGQRADLTVRAAGQAIALLAIAVASHDPHAEGRRGVPVPGVGDRKTIAFSAKPSRSQAFGSSL
jgi:hypothetical protein